MVPTFKEICGLVVAAAAARVQMCLEPSPQPGVGQASAELQTFCG